MWKYARIAIWITVSLIAAVVVAVPNVDALRDTGFGRVISMLYLPSVDVTITVTPAWGAMPVTNFKVEEVSGAVVASWTNSPTGTATMVRAKYGSAPTNINDGYLVYYGPLDTATDTGVNVDENMSQVVYVAWADTLSGWSLPVQAIYEDGRMALILITAAFIALAFWRQTPALKVVSGIVAIVFGAYWATVVLNSYVYMATGVGFCVIGLYMILTAWSKHA